MYNRNLKLLFYCLIFLALEVNGSTFRDTSLVFEKDLSGRFLHIDPSLRNNDLIAHWPLDEGSGFICKDWSKNNLNAYLTGSEWNTKDGTLTSSIWKRGKRGACIYLNETQWLQIKDTSILNFQESFSVVLWIKPEDIVNSILLSKNLDKKGYNLSMGQDGSFSFKFFNKNKKLYTYCSPKGIINSDIWQQVGISYNSNEELIKLIYNGQFVSMDHIEDVIEHSANDLSVGGAINSKECFKGCIDELSLLQKSVSEEETKWLYLVGMPKIYLQTRETIDKDLSVWNHPHGNKPIPHPINDEVLLSLRFDGNLNSFQGHKPIDIEEGISYSPGMFGAALNTTGARRGLCYTDIMKTSEGTFESWIQLSSDANRLTPLGSFENNHSSIEIKLSGSEILVRVENSENADSLILKDIMLPFNRLIHIGLSWKEVRDSTLFKLFLNGVEMHNIMIDARVSGFEKWWIGGNKEENFKGQIDDVCISGISKDWGAVCPRGIADTEASSIDLMSSFDNNTSEPLMHWTSNDLGKWSYGIKNWDNKDEAGCIIQEEASGIHTLYHPDAFGYNSSFETSISVDSIKDGWTGVFVQSPEVARGNFSGHAFMINFYSSEARISSFKDGSIMQEKVLMNDFQFERERVYLLTLSVIDGVLRGFIDNRNIISMLAKGDHEKGFAGLISLNSEAYFDDIHFSAITPSKELSRKISVEAIIEGEEVNFRELSINSFRWKKRYGLLPWERNYKNPEPPGNIFGPDDKTLRPNSSNFWRSEDAANSSIIFVNGTFYYFMRGNPDINGKHGNAQIGVLGCDAKDFDGIHFIDYSYGMGEKETIGILKGHEDTNQGNCFDDPPRNLRFQLNDQGCVYIDGKILLLCREFRNSNSNSSKFKRLVLGTYDIEKKAWVTETPGLLTWSSMNPDSCYGRLEGINATPELSLLRDPVTDKFIIFLYHHNSNSLLEKDPLRQRTCSSISGFNYDGRTLIKDPRYPEKIAVCKRNNGNIFGERVLFDNGIWYMNINSHSLQLDRDWPDRFELFTSLDPYWGSWCGSFENNNQDKPYFERGNEFDPDNGAIWQGEMMKYRNHYYMYYENYHVINNTEVMYEYYDHSQSGSRVGIAIAN
jgi:Concanavalin A-like lectin/glucanases superfamily